MKQTRLLSEFSRPSEFTRLYPRVPEKKCCTDTEDDYTKIDSPSLLLEENSMRQSIDAVNPACSVFTELALTYHKRKTKDGLMEVLIIDD